MEQSRASEQKKNRLGYLSIFDGVEVGFSVPDSCEAAVDLGAEGPLGNSAKYVGRFAARHYRKSLYFQQRHAAELLPQERVRNCRWIVQRRDSPVEVQLYETGSASYSGLQTCGSVWLCPVCSRKISEVRRTELNTLLAWSREQEYFPVLVTMTARHGRVDDLAELLGKMKAAKRRLRQRRDWKALKPFFVGSVSATEVTYGTSAGWHPHFHEIVILQAQTEAEAVAKMAAFSASWLSALAAEGLDGIDERAWQVQGAAAAGNYIGKWGAAEEVALAGQKKGRKGGRTPAQLLHDSAILGDERAGKLWQEFGRVFKGTRQLVWSDGLKALAGIDEIEDAAAAEEVEAQLVGLIDPETWSGRNGFVGAKYRRVKILEAAERGGAEEVFSVVHSQQEDDDLAEPDHEVIEGVEGISPTHQVTLEGPTKWEDTKSPYEQRDFATCSTSLASRSPIYPSEGERWLSSFLT